MVRPSLLLSVCLLVAVPGLAIAKTTPPADARPYVEASYISAPRVVWSYSPACYS